MGIALQGAANDGSQPSSHLGRRIGKALALVFDVQQLLPEVFRGALVLPKYLPTHRQTSLGGPAASPIKPLEIRLVLHCPPLRVIHFPRQTRQASRAPNSDIRGCENCIAVAQRGGWLSESSRWIRRASVPTGHRAHDLRHHLRHHLRHRSALDHQTCPTLRIDEPEPACAPRCSRPSAVSTRRVRTLTKRAGATPRNPSTN